MYYVTMACPDMSGLGIADKKVENQCELAGLGFANNRAENQYELGMLEGNMAADTMTLAR